MGRGVGSGRQQRTGECATRMEMSAPGTEVSTVQGTAKCLEHAVQPGVRSSDHVLLDRGCWKAKMLHKGVMSSYLYVKMQIRTKTRHLDCVIHDVI